jgi:hypothetical protein
MPQTSLGSQTLSKRALNRALLARQFLLVRAPISAYELIEHLVGLQAQEPHSPYISLWSRQSHFDPQELSALLIERKAVRMALMRSTVHLVSADDALSLRPLVQPVLERSLRGSHGKYLVDFDFQALAERSRALLEQEPLMLNELGRRLQAFWPERDASALAQAARAYLALIQPPPRAIWGQSGQALHTPIENWLGRPLEHAPSIEKLVLRYLAAFGPASVRDMQNWSGLSKLREVFERLRPCLRSFRNEDGLELFDLPDAPRPDSETPAPVRFLPDYDNILLGHADRSRIIDEAHRQRLLSIPQGLLPRNLLVDGFFAGQWVIQHLRKRAVLQIELIEPIDAASQSELIAEGEALLAWLASDAEERDIQFGPLHKL